MTPTDLRARIRELIVAGVLPTESAPVMRPGPTHTPGTRRSKTSVGGPHQEPCAICGEPGPQVQYFYVAGLVVRVHAACDALWKQEGMR